MLMFVVGVHRQIGLLINMKSIGSGLWCPQCSRSGNDEWDWIPCGEWIRVALYRQCESKEPIYRIYLQRHSQTSAKCYNYSQTSAQCYKCSQTSAKCYKYSQTSAKCYKYSDTPAKCYKYSQTSAKCYKYSQTSAKCYKFPDKMSKTFCLPTSQIMCLKDEGMWLVS